MIKTSPHIISTASTLIHAGRALLASAVALTNLTSRTIKTSASVATSAGIAKEEKHDASLAERKTESGAFGKRLEKQRGEVALGQDSRVL